MLFPLLEEMDHITPEPSRDIRNFMKKAGQKTRAGFDFQSDGEE
jgi:hypothetical protein